MSAAEIRSRITDQIITALSDPTKLPPWRKSWRTDKNAGHPCNVVSERRYTGINPLLLEIAAHRHGLQSKWWGTFRQWSDLGGQVKRRPADVPPGQWGTSIVFCRPVTKKSTDDSGEETEDKFFVLRSYVVFNLDQVDGPFDCLRVARQNWGTMDRAAKHHILKILFGGFVLEGSHLVTPGGTPLELFRAGVIIRG